MQDENSIHVFAREKAPLKGELSLKATERWGRIL